MLIVVRPCCDGRRAPRATHPSGRVGDLRRLRDSRRRRRTHPPRRDLDRGAAGTRRRGGGRRRAAPADPAFGRADRPARLPAPRGRRRGGGRGRVGRWPLARPPTPATSAPNAPTCACLPRRAPHPRSPRTRTCGSTGWRAMSTDNDDFYRIDTALILPQVSTHELVAAHPRHGGSRTDAQLRRSRRPPGGGAAGDPDVRVQPGRRRPDRQRPLARLPRRGPARRGRRAPRRRHGALPQQRQLHRRYPARGAHRRPRRDDRDRHERRTAAGRSTATRPGWWSPASTATSRPPSGSPNSR